MASRVPVVEDDDAIRFGLRLALEDEGYAVDDAASAEDGLLAVHRDPPDVMVVDLMLGGMDGFDFIRAARVSCGAPVIVVSARADTHDIVAALEVGADDYVTKPFEIKELSARLRALRRRSSSTPSGDERRPALVLDRAEPVLVLDLDAAAVHRGTQPVRLTVTELRLLCELAAVPGRVLSRHQLLERVWDRGFFGDERIVDVHVRRLRTKLELDPGAPRTVVTVRGLGYRLDLR